VKRGEPLGEDISMLKIWTTETTQRVNDLLLEIGAEDGVLAGVRDIDGVETDTLTSFYYARPGTIVGGYQRSAAQRSRALCVAVADLKKLAADKRRYTRINQRRLKQITLNARTRRMC